VFFFSNVTMPYSKCFEWEESVTRVIRFHSIGGPEVLQIDDISTTPPLAGEVNIRVKAIGLNRAEAMFRRGLYAFDPQLPQRMGYEAAGVVEALGENVSGFAIGDAVSVIPSLSMTRWPSYGEVATFPANLVMKHPAGLSWERAAAAWMQYITAYGGLVDVVKLQKNEPVLITAASSSVGIGAIQIANLVGARPIAVTRTGAKKQALLDVGACDVIVTNTENLVDSVKTIAGDTGVRIIFDPIGGKGVAALCTALSFRGMLIEYGNLSGEDAPFPAFAAIPGGLSVRGFAYSEIVGDDDRLIQAKRFITSGLASGALSPVVARTFTFEDIVAAHHYLESNEQFGKIVVTL
jgi:NADPH:quinone reductase-like Zn-dependent oxidoreductase